MLNNYLRASVLAATILAVSPGLALAQTAGTNGMATGTTATVGAESGNGYTRAGYGGGWSGWWGLWGLLGLFGLAGVRPRFRSAPPVGVSPTSDPRVGPGTRL